MGVGKEIYNAISKNWGDRKKRLHEQAEERIKQGLPPELPPTVDQYRKNIVTRAKSNSIHITELAGVKRQISPNEAMPAVNGKSGEEIVEKTVTKVKPKKKELDPTAGVIKPMETKSSNKPTSRKNSTKKCSNCSSPNHTKRTCPELA